MTPRPPEAETPAPAGQECAAHEFCLDSDHALERRAAVKKQIATLEERVRLLSDALKNVRPSVANAEQYMGSIARSTKWSRRVRNEVDKALTIIDAALNPNQPEEPKP